MRMIAAIADVRHGELRPVFSGGTSLSKGYGLIQRFSEDLDFKLLSPEADIGRSLRRSYRAAVIDAIRADDAWTIGDGDVLAGNESRFFRCEVGYPSSLAPAYPLRAGIRVEVTLAAPKLPPEERSLRSLVAEARREDPEVARIACVSPAETAADKLSALTWRALSRCRGGEGDDDMLVRHLHDLASLEAHAMEHRRFPEVTRRLFDTDASRAGLPSGFVEMAPVERVAVALKVLAADPEYKNEYERFVSAMCYGNENDTPAFASALETFRRLGRLLS